MKKILSVLLVTLICVSACAATFSAAGLGTAGGLETGATFLFGSYPQNLVNDFGLLGNLSGSLFGSQIRLGGSTYRALRLTEPSIPGQGGYFATIYGYNDSTTYWFAYAPIAWRVLDVADDGVLLMAENVLDTYAFNKTKANSTWENSDLRAWLNGEFLRTAFTAKEQSFILESTNVNEDNPVHGSYNGVPSAYSGDFYGGYPYQGTESGNDTVDRVFLPSFDEITTEAYGFNVGYHWVGDYGQDVNYYVSGAASGRQAIATQYAQGRGVWTNTLADDTTPANEFCRYWLRTAGYEDGFAAAVLEDGRVSTGWPVNYNVVGVRPMIRVSPEAVENLMIGVNFPDSPLRYRNPSVQLTANADVTWSTSDPSVATIDENGVLTVHNVGTADITATLVDDPDVSVTATVEVRYAWWQWIIRIFLFGWLWY